MTEFKQELRHHCRNPKCRSKLPAPIANEREAFCCRGCYSSFYLHRCRVCEQHIEQPKHGQRIICKRSKCRTAWESRLGFGRYANRDSGQGSQNRESYAAEPIKSGTKSPLKPDRAWRIIAGPPLTPNQLHCATVPDGKLGPDGLPTWEGGEYERIEKRNRAALAAHFDKLDAEAVANDLCTACRREDDLVDRRVMGANGYPPRGLERWETICRECLAEHSADRRASRPTSAQYLIPDDLSIPQFLRRPLPLERDSDSYRLAA
jgi:hypothetical protein